MMLCVFAGLATNTVNRAFVFILFFTAIILSCFNLFKRNLKKEATLRLIIFASLFVLSFFNYSFQKKSYDFKAYKLKNSEVSSYDGVIKNKSFKNDKFIYEVKLKEGAVIVYDKNIEREFKLGEKISFSGRLLGFEKPRNEGEFNEEAYYLGRKILAKAFPDDITSLEMPKIGYMETMYRLRVSLCNIFVLSTDADSAGILSAMVAGEKSLLDEGVSEDFRTVGIFHILCISGLHISILGMSLYAILRKIKIRRLEASFISGYFLISYLLLSGMAVSALRAVVMFFVYLLSDNLGENKDSVSSLSLTATAFMFINPFLLNQAGFVFSFYMFLMVNVVSDHLDNRFGKHLNMLIGAVLIFNFSLPVTALFYYEVPTLSFLLNIMISPLVGVLLANAVVAGAMGLFFLPVAKYALVPANLICKLFIFTVKATVNIPFSTLITGHPSSLRVSICVAIALGAVFLIKNSEAVSDLASNLLYRKKKMSAGEVFYKKKRINILNLALAILIFPVMILAILNLPHESGFVSSFLDVGQGDGIYVRTAEGINLFVDGGSSSKSKVGEYTIKKYLKYKGIKKIDVWAISHLDNDHVSGFKELIGDYDIGCVLVGANNVYDEDYAGLKERIAENNIDLYELAKGDEVNIKDLRLKVLLPKKKDYTHDRNKDSLVLLMESDGVNILFTGDISSEEEESLVNELQRVDVFKASHHGSKYSNSKVLLERIKPAIAVISCDKHNNYGHPSMEAVQNMEKSGAKVYYTMNNGRIMLKKKRGKLYIYANN